MSVFEHNMARRTKEESAQTRQRIVAAARRTFLQRGMTGTTLEHVAEASGVTRGAIYWHFATKKALFDAMRSEVSLPMLDRTDVALLEMGRNDPLRCVQKFLNGMVDAVATCAETRETFEIMAFKCEYVAEFEGELKGHRGKAVEIADRLTVVYRRAKALKMLRAGLAPRTAALETVAFLMGLMRLWLLDSDGTIIRRSAPALIAAHVNGRRG
jgi:TetR/AcrR family acrAB operon transcriptional repressor